jgi:nicotinamide-nucleotide amidase
MERPEVEIARLIRQIHDKTGKFVTIGAVESATGGRIADRITDVAGSSDYFQGALVSYSNEIKTAVAGVNPGTLNARGAVSHETGCEMAKGGRRLLKTDLCVSSTGIAGPGGATKNKPVGLFYIGLSTRKDVKAWKYIFSGNREQVKQKATDAALHVLADSMIGIYCSVYRVRLAEIHVVTCFLEQVGDILILRRSGKVGTYKRAWAGISGYIETDDVKQAVKEINEETGLRKNDIQLSRQGEPLDVYDLVLQRKWVVHPFLFHIKDPEKIKIDWEHTESRWIRPGTLNKFKTVPGLDRALQRVWP